jgi:hypothetical protein
MVWMTVALVWAIGSATWASDERSVRLVGSAPTAQDPAAKSFVLDLTLSKGEAPGQQQIDGWFAALPPTVGSAEVSGTCVRTTCVITVDLDNAKLSFDGDFTGAASSGRFALTDNDDKPMAEGAASFAPVAGPIAGLGVLAAPDAVSGAELKSLLEWNQASVEVIGNVLPDMPDDVERDALSSWQNANNAPATGLIFVSDLAALRRHAQDAKAAAGWTPLGDAKQGWSAGYPAKLMPTAGPAGAEHRFASVDGKASLLVAIAPPLDDDAFSALVDKVTAESPTQTDKNYNRVNGDMTVTYVEAGRRVIDVYHNREGGLGRLTFSRPADQADAWELYDDVIPGGFEVTDDLKAP